MESNETCPQAIRKALQLTVPYWNELSERHGWMDDAVQLYCNSPLFQYEYTGTAARSSQEFIYDMRTSVALIANRLFTEQEVRAFHDEGFLLQLQHGVILAARILRERVQVMDLTKLVHTTRTMALTYALKVIGENMRDPRVLFRRVIERLEMDDHARMNLFQKSIMNTQAQSSRLVLH